MYRMRFYFKCFSTEYAHILKAISLKQAMTAKKNLKADILAQVNRYPPLRGRGPWKMDITYRTLRHFPVSNYGEITHYIIEALTYKTIIPDNALGVIQEINIKVQPLLDGQKEGAMIIFTKTEPYKVSKLKDNEL